MIEEQMQRAKDPSRESSSSDKVLHAAEGLLWRDQKSIKGTLTFFEN